MTTQSSDQAEAALPATTAAAHDNDGPQPEDTEPPKYALRLSDLRAWHYLEAACFNHRCRHRLMLDPQRFVKRWGPNELVRRLEEKLVCTKCGNRFGNVFTVMKLPRNW